MQMVDWSLCVVLHASYFMEWQRILLLQDHNTRVVVLGTTILGLMAGMIGSFTLLRKRALLADALSHATLPGICLAFMLTSAWGGNPKSLPILLLGAAATGLVGTSCILFIRKFTRLKEDAALGIVLSVFFGAGIALLGLVQEMRSGDAAGLKTFIYGQAAAMLAKDAWLIGGAGLVSAALCLLFFKELRLLCFDEGYAGSRGLPVMVLDGLLMALVVVVTIIGLQAVGLILIIALLVIPAAAARFWTEHLTPMLLIAAAIGGLSGMVGSLLSGIFAELPTGAMIVLTASASFLFSLVVGTSRGILVRWLHRWRLNNKIDRQHLLRGIYEHLEEAAGSSRAATQALEHSVISYSSLLAMRSWSSGRLRRLLRRVRRQGLVQIEANGVRLTARGFQEAARLARDHRLWELYLIAYADVAPGKVDREADAIEHVLEPEIIAQLEKLLVQKNALQGVPSSPHPLQTGA